MEVNVIIFLRALFVVDFLEVMHVVLIKMFAQIFFELHAYFSEFICLINGYDQQLTNN